MKIPTRLREWVITMSRSGHSVETMIDMMCATGYGRRQSKLILAQVLDRPAIALDDVTVPRAKPRKRASGGLRATAPEAPGMVIGDRHISVSTSTASPELRVLHNMLDASECDALIEQARPRLDRSQTVDTQGNKQYDVARTSSGMFFNVGETALIREIDARLAALVDMPVSHGEALQVLHYLPGQQYEPHQDWFDPKFDSYEHVTRVGGQRIATIIMYLNTPEAGGGTHFPHLGLTVAAHRGDAVYFAYETGSADALHAGLPVEKGEKWIATRWLRERPYHEA